MPFDFNPQEAEFDGQDPFKGGGRPAAGKYHCELTEAREMEQGNAVLLTFQIHSPGEECGKTFTHIVNYSGKTAESTKKVQRRCLGFAVALGMTTLDAVAEAQAKGEGVSLDFTTAGIGCHAIVELVDDTYLDKKTETKKPTVTIPWAGIWNLADPRVWDVPISAELAALVGYVKPATPPEGYKPPADGQAGAAAGGKPGGKPAGGAAGKSAGGTKPAAARPTPQQRYADI